MSAETVRVVERYFDALKNKELTRVPLASDVTFEGPLSPKLTGRAAVQEFLTGILPGIRDVRIRRHIAEGEYVATIFEFDTAFGVVPVCDCFRVVDGELKEIRPFFDPRPIIEGMARQSPGSPA